MKETMACQNPKAIPTGNLIQMNFLILHFKILYMKKLLQAEELLMFAACLYYYPSFGLSWWWFAGFLLLPDIGMIGYIFNPRLGAITYNLLHHRGLALMIFFAGLLLTSLPLQFAAFILFAHASMDRMFGYGLKYEKGFRFTHLGAIGHDPQAA
jgi:hypothetical protein